MENCIALRSSKSAWPGGLAIILALLDLIWYDASILASALVDLSLVPRSLTFGLELVAAGAEFSDRLFR